jgi:hypothetical protein
LAQVVQATRVVLAVLVTMCLRLLVAHLCSRVAVAVAVVSLRVVRAVRLLVVRAVLLRTGLVRLQIRQAVVVVALTVLVVLVAAAVRALCMFVVARVTQ